MNASSFGPRTLLRNAWRSCRCGLTNDSWLPLMSMSSPSFNGASVLCAKNEIFCGVPSSKTSKSSCVRSVTSLPVASRTLNPTFTRWTSTRIGCCAGSRTAAARIVNEGRTSRISSNFNTLPDVKRTHVRHLRTEHVQRYAVVSPMQLEKIQQEIRNQNLDGWLFFDHHMRDPLAYRVLGLKPPAAPTRRWYYLIPANGEPRGLEHRIERGMTGNLPGEKIPYSSWTEQKAALAKILGGLKRVAMQYSPMCAIPYVSMVDGGTIELIRDLGVDVVSSAELIQAFEARWTPAALESHLEAGRRVDKVRAEAFALIHERTRNGVPVTEFDVKDLVRTNFAAAGLFTDHGPIVGCNANASNPHYDPFADACSPIKAGDWVLLDMWAKLDQPGAVYYDITWTAYCGDNPPERIRNVFNVV